MKRLKALNKRLPIIKHIEHLLSTTSATEVDIVKDLERDAADRKLTTAMAYAEYLHHSFTHCKQRQPASGDNDADGTVE